MKDTEKILTCPACGKEMSKIMLDSAGFMVDICLDGCGGIWLDNRELDKIDEKAECTDDLKNAIEGKTFEKVDTSKDRKCPVCGASMVKNSTSIHRNIELDECYSCGGKFLDHNELEAIRSEYESTADRSQDVLCAASDSEYMRKLFYELVNKNKQQ